MIGKRVEIAPHYDLWMRGARYGEVRKIVTTKDGRKIAHVKMDHPQVRKLARIPLDDLKEV